MNGKDIPGKLKERIEQELQLDEQVEWLGVPIPRYFTGTATKGVLLGILWTAFSIFWTYGFAGQENFTFALILGIPFTLIGLAILCDPIRSYHKALKTAYAITNKRAIIIEEGWSCGTQSYYPSNLQSISCKQKKDGTGDVIISCQALRDSRIARYTEPLGFLHIKNPKEIEKKLKKLAEQSAEADV